MSLKNKMIPSMSTL